MGSRRTIVVRVLGIAAVTLAVTLAGCFNDSSSDRTNFTTFVKATIANDTTLSAEPKQTNSRRFFFPDNDNPEAFDDLL